MSPQGTRCRGASAAVCALLLAAPLAAPLAGLLAGARAPHGSGAYAQSANPDAEPGQSRVTKGPVTAHVHLAPHAPRLGDDLTLVIEVTAEPGVEVLMPAYGEAIEQFEVIGFLEDQTIDAAGRTVHRQEYRLQCSRSGDQRIPELLIEFVDRRPGQKAAPEDEDAYELFSEAVLFTVASVLPEEAAPALRPPREALPPLPPPAPRRWPYVLAIALALTALAPLALRAWVAHRRRARQRSAYDLARARLVELLARPRPTDAATMDHFFVELSALVRRYLEDRFTLRAPELTTEEFLALTGDSPDLTSAHRRLLRDFLRGADLVKFAHHVPSLQDLEAAIDSARRFLDETREHAPLIDVAAEATSNTRREVSRV